MILAALLAAAAVGATPTPDVHLLPLPASPDVRVLPEYGPQSVSRFAAPANCGDIHREVVNRQAEQFRKLGRLPNGVALYAVERKVGGCGVPTPMGYHPDYLLPGAADSAKPEK